MALHPPAVRVIPALVVAFLGAAIAAGCSVQSVESLPHGGAGPSGGDSSDAPSSSSSGSSSGAGSGSSSGGGVFSDANACSPGSVQTFQPGPYRPATAAWQGACVATSLGDPIQAFYDACLGNSATNDLCAAFATDYTACAACILTPDTADHYGPLINHGGFVTGNIAGCLELTDPGQLSCAKSVQALSQCELASCQANCPVADAPSLDAYNACAAQADETGCMSFSTAASCADWLPDASGAAACLVSDFKQFYDAVVPLFCGSPPPPMMIDAGASFDAGAPWGGDSGISTGDDAATD
jgi:hypothetical protein